MNNYRTLRLALGAGLLSTAVFTDAQFAAADFAYTTTASHYGRKASAEAQISLRTSDLQPIANSFAFGVNHASFKNRRLWVVGDLLNASAITYRQLQLLVMTEHGAKQRVSVGSLAPGRSRRVQIQLTTRCDHRPRSIHVTFTQAIADYQPMPRTLEKPGGFGPKQDSIVPMQISAGRF